MPTFCPNSTAVRLLRHGFAGCAGDRWGSTSSRRIRRRSIQTRAWAGSVQSTRPGSIHQTATSTRRTDGAVGLRPGSRRLRIRRRSLRVERKSRAGSRECSGPRPISQPYPHGPRTIRTPLPPARSPTTAESTLGLSGYGYDEKQRPDKRANQHAFHNGPPSPTSFQLQQRDHFRFV